MINQKLCIQERYKHLLFFLVKTPRNVWFGISSLCLLFWLVLILVVFAL